MAEILATRGYRTAAFVASAVLDPDRGLSQGFDVYHPAPTAEGARANRRERRGDQVERQDRWPTEADLGALVILPGGEVGRLMAWWNADDGSEWRWQVEFYNHV